MQITGQWNSGHHFSLIGHQEGTISDPAYRFKTGAVIEHQN